MVRTWRCVRLVIAVAVVVAAGVVSPTAIAAAARDVGVALAGQVVTLVTGDRVVLGGPRGCSVRAAAGRARVAFHTRVDERGDRHVVPEDALVPVSSGRLDPRLFNVSEFGA